jgi:mRNA-degrading endonuclease YafQ of YafQ-DinJ toxin-antitoxin module
MLEAKYEPGFSRDIKTQQKKHRDMNKLKYATCLARKAVSDFSALDEGIPGFS